VVTYSSNHHSFTITRSKKSKRRTSKQASPHAAPLWNRTATERRDCEMDVTLFLKLPEYLIITHHLNIAWHCRECLTVLVSGVVVKFSSFLSFSSPSAFSFFLLRCFVFISLSYFPLVQGPSRPLREQCSLRPLRQEFETFFPSQQN